MRNACVLGLHEARCCFTLYNLVIVNGQINGSSGAKKRGQVPRRRKRERKGTCVNHRSCSYTGRIFHDPEFVLATGENRVLAIVITFSFACFFPLLFFLPFISASIKFERYSMFFIGRFQVGIGCPF